MGNQKILISLFGAIIVAVIGFTFLKGSSNQSPQQNIQNTQVSEASSQQYVSYSTENLAKAQESGRTLLYFWASWCPTCKVLDQELKEKGDELPADLTILQVNYDTEKELKQKYQITQQHTLVQIDESGNEVKKWIGGGIETIKQQLK